MNDPIQKPKIKLGEKLIIFVVGFSIGAFVVWYGFRPYSICPDPKTLERKISFTLQPNWDRHLYECYRE